MSTRGRVGDTLRSLGEPAASSVQRNGDHREPIQSVRGAAARSSTTSGTGAQLPTPIVQPRRYRVRRPSAAPSSPGTQRRPTCAACAAGRPARATAAGVRKETRGPLDARSGGRRLGARLRSPQKAQPGRIREVHEALTYDDVLEEVVVRRHGCDVAASAAGALSEGALSGDPSVLRPARRLARGARGTERGYRSWAHRATRVKQAKHEGQSAVTKVAAVAALCARDGKPRSLPKAVDRIPRSNTAPPARAPQRSHPPFAVYLRHQHPTRRVLPPPPSHTLPPLLAPAPGRASSAYGHPRRTHHTLPRPCRTATVRCDHTLVPAAPPLRRTVYIASTTASTPRPQDDQHR
jgi:hypothetical protein